jgi:hypothetical protein
MAGSLPFAPVRPLRPLLALAAGAVVSALGANILGEYEFEGVTPLFAGLLFGLALGEVVATVGRQRTWPLAVATAAIAGAGSWWAARISTSFGLLPLPWEAWAATALAAFAGLLRLRPRSTPAGDSPPPPAP